MPSAFPSALLASGRPLTLRGSGHSCDGQTVTDGELLVTYAPEVSGRQIHDLGDGLFEVPAGASWYVVERHLNQRSRSFPVLPNHLHMSVGGTLSVGGVGIDSVRYGMQVDHVQRIQLIDGTGASRWCSRDEHGELFRFALGGLGLVGLIERVVLRTVPYRIFSYLRHHEHSDLTALVAHTQQVARRSDVDVFYGLVRDGVTTSVSGWRGEHPESFAAGELTIVPDLSFTGQSDVTAPGFERPGHIHLWADYVVPIEQLAPMTTAVAAVQGRSPLKHCAVMIYILMLRRRADAPSFAFGPVGTAPVSVGVGIYVLTTEESHETSAVRGEFRELLTVCCAVGGRPYLYGTADPDRRQLGQLYGADLERLAWLRRNFRLEHVNSHVRLAEAAHSLRW